MHLDIWWQKGTTLLPSPYFILREWFVFIKEREYKNVLLYSSDFKQFRKAIRGYDADEVDEFIEKVSEDYEALYKENSVYREKTLSFEEKLEHYKKLENTIQNTLLLAQNSADQAKQSAQKEAELIIKNANDSAKLIIEKANNDVIRINDDYEGLKQEFFKFRTRYKNFMTSQLEMFNDMEADFIKYYNVGSIIEETISSKEIDSTEEEVDFNVSKINLEEKNFNDNLESVKNFFVEDK